MTNPKENLIGVISDTHGLLRPEALKAMAGAELIVHAGDIGKPQVLQQLGTIAPVHAVRGNTDRESWARHLPGTQAIQVGGVWLYVIHDLGGMDLDPVAAGFRVVISGHSHRPSVRDVGGVLFLNPGSAGPRRLDLPVSVARLSVRGNQLQATLVELDSGVSHD